VGKIADAVVIGSRIVQEIADAAERGGANVRVRSRRIRSER
jgi:tryptophan synthase alpha subunit